MREITFNLLDYMGGYKCRMHSNTVVKIQKGISKQVREDEAQQLFGLTVDVKQCKVAHQ